MAANGVEETVKETVEETVREIIRTTLKLPDHAIPATANLRDLPGVESFSTFKIIASLEKRFGVRLDDQIVFRVNTVQELASEVARLVDERPSP